jgi:hypothetical protein
VKQNGCEDCCKSGFGFVRKRVILLDPVPNPKILSHTRIQIRPTTVDHLYLFINFLERLTMTTQTMQKFDTRTNTIDVPIRYTVTEFWTSNSRIQIQIQSGIRVKSRIRTRIRINPVPDPYQSGSGSVSIRFRIRINPVPDPYQYGSGSVSIRFRARIYPVPEPEHWTWDGNEENLEEKRINWTRANGTMDVEDREHWLVTNRILESSCWLIFVDKVPLQCRAL